MCYFLWYVTSFEFHIGIILHIVAANTVLHKIVTLSEVGEVVD